MKLSKYIEHLQAIKKNHGGELEVVYTSDDEGNDFDYLHFAPSVGIFTEDGETTVCVN